MSSLYFTGDGSSKVDAIVAFDQLYRQDPNPEKINLVIGVYRNENGITPVLSAVKGAEERLLKGETSKAYLPSAGEAAFVRDAETLVFGAGNRRLAEGTVHSIQTPGSTGALRAAGEFVRQRMPHASVWLGTPAYSNHKPIFQACGLAIETYRYYDVARGETTFADSLADLEKTKPGDVVVLHAVCHNPSGADLTLDEWERLARFMTERALLPLVDAAYLGIGGPIDDDAAGIRKLVDICPEVLVATSFSKNFALYGERVGLLSVFASSPAHCQMASHDLTAIVRALYTSPPSHGARVVAGILADENLRQLWLSELETMRNRMRDMRAHFARLLDEHEVRGSLFPHLRDNRGMFALSMLTPEHARRLREEHHIYLLDSGRISVAGMQEGDLPRICSAIARVTGGRP